LPDMQEPENQNRIEMSRPRGGFDIQGIILTICLSGCFYPFFLGSPCFPIVVSPVFTAPPPRGYKLCFHIAPPPSYCPIHLRLFTSLPSFLINQSAPFFFPDFFCSRHFVFWSFLPCIRCFRGTPLLHFFPPHRFRVLPIREVSFLFFRPCRSSISHRNPRHPPNLYLRCRSKQLHLCCL